MILALLGSAFALECREVVNMGAAGVPLEEIVRQMDLAGTPPDRDFISCLAAWNVDSNVVNAAWRLNAVREDRPVPLHAEHIVEVPTWVELDVTCGSVSVTGEVGRTVVIDGMGDARAKLTATPSGGGLRVHVDAGTLADGPDPAQRPKFSRSDNPVKNSPTVERPCADIDVRVPRESRVVVKSTRADVQVRFVKGPVELASHFGNLDLVGDTEEVVLKTTSGNILSDTGAKHVDIETVSGMVQVSVGSEARVVASSISGPIWIWGGAIQRLSVNSVSGDLRLNAAIVESGNALLQTHKGNIEAHVPSGEIMATSHEGLASGPSKLVRPDGPTQRVKRNTLKPPDRFTGLSMLGADTFGVWAKQQPERWWFGSGAVISRALEMKASGFTLSASSFSGNVNVVNAERFPSATGPVIAQMEAVAPRFEACSKDQLKRTPGSSGHAVLTLRLEKDGSVASAQAPATSSSPEDVADGAFSSCLVRAVEKLQFAEGGEAELRWPVAYHPPVQIEPVSPPSGALSPVVDVRRTPVR